MYKFSDRFYNHERGTHVATYMGFTRKLKGCDVTTLACN